MKKIIKLRDLTNEDYEKWMNKMCGELSCKCCVFGTVNCRDPEYKDSWFNNKDMFSDKFLNQTVEIEVPDILTKEEKEYLSSVIKPFKNRIVDIKKVGFDDTNFIAITVVNAIHSLAKESINFPYFKKDEMYKNMKENYSYTLEELGL